MYTNKFWKGNPLETRKSHKIWIYQTRFYWVCSWAVMVDGARSRENLFMPYANNKGADQPAHPCSLISTFVVRCLDSIILLVSISEIWSLYLASVAAQTGLCLPWSETPKTGFLVTRLNPTLHTSSSRSLSSTIYLSWAMRKCVLWHMRTTKTQISLRIRAVRSAPLLFAA